jgi:uncharacterized hydrophobic protein (TIGR00341 family)
MVLRLIEMILSEKDNLMVRELLKERKVLEYREARLSDGEVLVRILLEAEQGEAILDLLEQQYAKEKDTPVVILPVVATLPRDNAEQTNASEKLPDRMGREELYEDIKNAAQCSRVYLAMTVLSTIVATVGLYYNSVAIIIGAMVIAPSIGPSMALSLGSALGDLSLLWRAMLTGLIGIAVSILLSVIIGTIVHIDPSVTEVASRTNVGLGDIIVALAAGCAGALAFTTGVSATLIGVMVAVALLPPLVVFGILLGGWQIALSMGALSLFLMNMICVNLAGVTTFLIQGIHPVTWDEKGRAKKATIIAIGVWMIMLVALVFLILHLQKGRI